jgi:type III pantothenate kinase
MNLALDFGNTSVKAGLFKGRDPIEIRIFNTPHELEKSEDFFKQASNCIVGSVTKQHEGFESLLNPECKLTEFTSKTRIPLVNTYQTASTLGSDRLAASIGAFTLYPNKNVLVIDAGTCLKFNFTTSSNEYKGGAISPGLQMRFRALHEFTARLPLVKFDDSFDKLVGESTEESILSGVLNGFAGETDYIIDQYKQQYTGLIVVVTGGDEPFLSKHLKNRIFAHPNMVLRGLNEILIYNS